MRLFLALVFLVVSGLPAQAADRIGRVKTLEGDAVILRADDRVPASVHLPIFENDRIETGDDGRLGITFRDNTTFSLGPNSVVTIDSFIFEPDRGRLSFGTGLLKGSMNYISGSIAKLRPQAVKLITPVATIGIRGTHLAARLADAEGVATGGIDFPNRARGRELLWYVPKTVAVPESAFVLLPNPEGGVGAVTITNASGTRVLDQALAVTRAQADDPTLSQVAVLDEDGVRDLFGDAIDAHPARPESFTFFFQSGTAELTTESKAQLPEILGSIRARESVDLSVAGHSDRVGSPAANRRLSLERAQVVLAFLAEGGLDTTDTLVESFGESDPLVRTADGVAESRNRRVELSVQ